ncbi:hypothetical protein RirG_000690 [Rhizophagus irregularis DAOM 197198w]|uniref:Uncharacterized protein n=3 Tax=Rhizophagus irregularis TaxID=588596 RepID=A0A015LJL4_RHIIW|nr:hypothetical protein RirG_000690 [Rhizophagus irregularis DAOM 197198w]
MPGSASPKSPTNQSELSVDSIIDENLNINEILKDMDKAEGALNELDERLDNLNAKIDAMLEEQTPKLEDEKKPKPTEEKKQSYYK